MTLHRIGVLGGGLMGSGIAEVAARAGHEVRVLELDEAAIHAVQARILRSLEKGVDREKITAPQKDDALDRLSYTTEVSSLADRDLVIEAVVEDLEVKRHLLGQLDAICPEHTIFASNTSSLAITDLAAAVGRADRVVGLHFFNPVPLMRLVEVVRTIATSEDTLAAAHRFVTSLDKDAISAPDSSGFLVNRLLVPFMLDAIRLLEAGASSVEDLDNSLVLGCGHPMGPLALCDFVGNDTVERISEIMFDEYRLARYAPPPLLRRLVGMGRYGRKSGSGFYDYSGAEPVAMRF